MKELTNRYLTALNQACLINTAGVRKARINAVLMDMRRDRDIPHLTLCAFLQDNARLIKENLQ